MHAAGRDRLTALADLATRLKAQRPGLAVVVTAEVPAAGQPARPGSDPVLAIWPDHPALARRFLDHWRPSVCLWAGGDLMPNLIVESAEAAVPLVLIDVGPEDMPPRRRWLPDLTRAVLGCFATILTRDAETAALIRRSGVPETRVRVSAPRRARARPPRSNDDDLAHLSGDLARRPMWLAAGVQAGEVDPVLGAHCQAVRLVHRLLLVLAPADPASTGVLKDRLTEVGLRFVDWDEGDHIGEQAQVVITTDPRDLGLWYRAAPVAFVASTLVPGPGGRNPLEAAALGAAILHGPERGEFGEAFASLAAAGATREVRDAESLGAEVLRLSAPDVAARMALAGWDVVTEGAQLTDRLIDMVQDMLDAQEDRRAGA
jgi:3-deoxy-D-manno-octulosonic-acid transferase